MNEETVPLRPAKRKQPVKPSEGKNKTVTVSESAFNQVGQQATKLKLSKSEYASAAIAFFAESGLNPTTERPAGLAQLSGQVSKQTFAVRQQNVEISNREVAIIRNWEKNLYGFLQQQQTSLHTFLQQIEGNILRHQVLVEINLLQPMIEQLLKGNLESYIGRGLGARIYLEAIKQPAARWEEQNDLLSQERDEKLVAALREFMREHTVAAPSSTRKPEITAMPAKAETAPATKPGTPAKT